MNLPHIPIIRFGEVYESIDTLPVKDHRNGQVIANLSQANPGLIRRDLIKLKKQENELSSWPIEKLVKVIHDAGELFVTEPLPVGIGNATHSLKQYVESLSATTGIPQVICRANMEKIRHVLTHIPNVLHGLTRGLDLAVLDGNICTMDHVDLCFFRSANSLGVIMPSNSPGVNSLWIPAIALKVPLIIKPGKYDPWTPWRLIQALIAAGIPKSIFCYYPTSHQGAETISEGCDKSILFGNQNTINQYSHNPNINVHGPGYSKIVIGEDKIDHWQDSLDEIVESVSINGGRSCVNASAIVVPSRRAEIANVLAEFFAEITPLPLDDPNACLAAYVDHNVAHGINGLIEEGLRSGGAVDRTADHRDQIRLTDLKGNPFLLPTVIECIDPEHPLAKTEFMFPYVSVVELPQKEIIKWLGPSLAVTAITEDPEFIQDLIHCPYINRLNLGPIPTTTIDWSQPHEGNLFDFLYQRRALQRV